MLRFPEAGAYATLLLLAVGGCWASTTPSERPGQSAPSSDTSATPLAPDSVWTDSFKEAVAPFTASPSPSRTDSAVLRRWADSLGEKGRSIWRQKPERAREQFRQARHAHRVLTDSAAVAEIIGDIGVTYFFQSRYEEAMDHYEKALTLYRALDNQNGTANTLGNIGLIRWSQGQYEEALTRYRHSLRIKREIGNRAGVARSLGNISIIYDTRGRYRKAYARSQEALKIYRDLGDRDGIASSLSNMGSIRLSQGQHEKALTQYRKSLRVERELGNQRGVATSLSNIGTIYQEQGRYQEALSQYREALRIKREIGDRKGVASSLGNIGGIYEDQGRPQEALSQYREALRIKREIGDRPGIANSLSNIGGIHQTEGRYDEALDDLQTALRINRGLGNRTDIVDNLDAIGSVHLHRAALQAATDTLRRAVRIAEELRRSATSPDARRSLLSRQIDTYRGLTTAHVRAGRPGPALRSVEHARARLLADRLAGTATGDTSFALPSTSELHQTLGPDEAALLYANARSEHPLTALVVTRDTIVTRELPDSTVWATIGAEYSTRLTRLRREEDGLLGAATGPNTSSGPDRTPNLAEAIRLYRSVLTREEADSSIRNDLSRRLHELLVGPVLDLVDGKSELITVPTGALGYLPFETLRDPDGQYLIENRRVRYAQSITVLRQLQRRDHPQHERSILALGGANYDLQPPARGGTLVAEARRGTTDVRSEEHAATLFRDAVRQMDQGRSPRQAYRQLGYDQWPRLPGTKLEVRKLKRAASGGARLLTGSAASEEQVRRMSAAGRLARYRHVHFATHGMAVPEAPALSALVLSQQGASDSLAAADGYLTMDEIAELNLQADVAVLSACQTGLGKVVAGEGVVSLSHAFLRAGANATLVSQWRVLDWSTQQFMTATYRRAQADTTSFAEAVTQVKRAFIDGTFGARNTDPLRWAPFVYYGRE